jgi:hypothetical protein
MFFYEYWSEEGEKKASGSIITPIGREFFINQG